LPTAELPSQAILERTHAGVHDECVVCGSANRFGLRFAVQPDGAVSATVTCTAALQGYEGIVQGGVVSALLDSAMTNALYARGVVALTARLSVRFLRPVATGSELHLRGWLLEARPPLFRMTAEIRQAGAIAARAQGEFLLRGSSGQSSACGLETLCSARHYKKY
jgi:uncharacterized protein (TIGR00369 family)